MTQYDSGRPESTDSKLTFDRRSPHTVCGQSEPMPTDSILLKSTVSFEDPEFTVDGWHTNKEEIPEHRIARQEVTIQISSASAVEEFSLTTSVEPELARDLADALLEAADIADGNYADREDGSGGD
jgi:hypothetical protein